MSLPDEKIDADEALALLERAVGEKGEAYVDPNTDIDGCMYFSLNPEDNYGPCCIVGHVLYYKGVRIDDIEDVTNSIGAHLFLNEETNVDNLAEEIPLFTPQAVEVLMAAQVEQDKGLTWGKALEMARGRAVALKDPGMAR